MTPIRTNPSCLLFFLLSLGLGIDPTITGTGLMSNVKVRNRVKVKVIHPHTHTASKKLVSRVWDAYRLVQSKKWSFGRSYTGRRVPAAAAYSFLPSLPRQTQKPLFHHTHTQALSGQLCQDRSILINNSDKKHSGKCWDGGSLLCRWNVQVMNSGLVQ